MTPACRRRSPARSAAPAARFPAARRTPTSRTPPAPERLRHGARGGLPARFRIPARRRGRSRRSRQHMGAADPPPGANSIDVAQISTSFTPRRSGGAVGRPGFTPGTCSACAARPAGARSPEKAVRSFRRLGRVPPFPSRSLLPQQVAAGGPPPVSRCADVPHSNRRPSSGLTVLGGGESVGHRVASAVRHLYLLYLCGRSRAGGLAGGTAGTGRPGRDRAGRPACGGTRPAGRWSFTPPQPPA